MNNNNNTYYDPEKKRTPLLRVVFIVLGIISVFLIIFLLTKACGKGPDLYSDLLEASKKYYKEDKLPVALGECSVVKLNELRDNNYLSNVENYTSCDDNKTYVKVCKLGNGDYQYTPFTACNNKETSFSEWKIGEEIDLVKNSSDVSFKYFGEVKQLGTKAYYPDNNTDVSKVAQYYVQAPNEEYTFKDSPEIAYKWYVEKQGREYYQNGSYSSTQPTGYTNKDSESSKTYISLTRPENATYRISNQNTVYAVENVSYPYRYVCIDENISGTVTSDLVCEKREGLTFKKTSKILFTCDGTNEVGANTICGTRGNWSSNSCEDSSMTKQSTTSDGYAIKKNLLTGKGCVSTTGYIVTDKIWKWYKNATIKSYYPSGQSNQDSEKTYFLTPPTAGAIKDEDTKTTAYKYYKLINTEDESTLSWVSIGKDFISEDELIYNFKELGYDVNSLSDIQNQDNIRYQLELSYRKRK